jgi:hypothetical protein
MGGNLRSGLVLLLALLAPGPMVGAEFGMDDPVLGPAERGQEYPRAASNGREYLVAWGDRRDEDGDHMYATRVSAAGAVLDPGGIGPLENASLGDLTWLKPAVASNGEDFLVVWADGDAIRARRVGANGALLDAAPITIATGPDAAYPAVAFGGGVYLATWQELHGTTYDIYGAIIGADGVPIGTSFLVSVADPGDGGTPGTPVAAPNDQMWSAVAFGSGSFLVVFADQRLPAAVFGARVTPSGALEGPNFLVRDGDGWYLADPALAFDAATQEWLVAWSRAGYIEGQRVAASGALSGPRLSISPVKVGLGSDVSASVASDGTDFLVAWHDAAAGGDIHGARVSGAGVIDAASLVASGPVGSAQTVPSLTSGAAGAILAVWQDDRSGAGDVWGARVDVTGARQDPTDVLVSNAANDERHAVAANAGTQTLVAWEDRRSVSSSDIYATRVDPCGGVLDPAGIGVAVATGDQKSPAIASDGTSYLVVWEDFRAGVADSDVYGQFVGSDGALLGSAFSISGSQPGNQGAPAVRFAGGEYLVVWQDARSEASGSDIYGAHVKPFGGSGVTEPGGFPIATALGDQNAPAVAFGGGHDLVVWQDFRAGERSQIYAARLDGTTIEDADGFAISADLGFTSAAAPAVAFDGAKFVVAWQDHSADYVSTSNIAAAQVDVNGARIVPDGGDSGTIWVSPGPVAQVAPSVAWNGTHAFVAWQSTPLAVGSHADVLGARLDVQTTPMNVLADDAHGVGFAQAPTSERRPHLVAGSNGQVLLVYDRFDPAPGFGATRARARRIDADGSAPPAACDAGLDAAAPARGAEDAGSPIGFPSPPPSNGSLPPEAGSAPSAELEEAAGCQCDQPARGGRTVLGELGAFLTAFLAFLAMRRAATRKM